MTTEMEKKFVENIKSALHENLSIIDLVDFAGKLQAAGEPELATILYRTWLSFNNTQWNHLVYFNLGVALATLADLDAAKLAYLQAIELSASFVPAHLNLANIYVQTGRLDEARGEWSCVLDNTSPANPEEKSWRQLATDNLARTHGTGG